MTELERARKHLLYCQGHLSWKRFQQEHGKHPPDWHAVAWAENNVLAALSWVWHEQERARIAATDGFDWTYFPRHVREHNAFPCEAFR